MKRMVTTLAVVTMLVLTAACSAQAENPELEPSSEKPVVESNAADTKLVDTTTKFEANAEDAWADALTPGLDYLTLVNRNHPYEFSGPYDRNLHERGNMVTFADAVDGDLIQLEKGAFAAFTLLKVHLDNYCDMQIGIYDAYRDYDTQLGYYTNSLRMFYGDLKDDPSYDGARDWQSRNPLAEPGYSETHTGLLFNVVIKHPRSVEDLESESADTPDWEWYTETPERTATIERFRILHENLADFGFIDRFPAGKEEWIGIPNEPYQIRFVGSSKIAHEIMDNGLSLEEYLGETEKFDLNYEPSAETLEKYLQ